MTGLWFAVISMLLAAMAVVLAKFGVKSTEGEAGAFIRTLVLAVAFWVTVFMSGSLGSIKTIAPMTFLYIAVSGIGWGLSHIFYFKALKTGTASKVVSVTHVSVVITAILSTLLTGSSGLTTLSAIALCLVIIGVIFITYKGKAPVWELIAVTIVVFAAFLVYYYLGDSISLWIKIAFAVVLTGFAIYLMINALRHHSAGKWLLFSLLSAVFAALTTYFFDSRVGAETMLIDGLRIIVVLIVCLVFLTVTGKWNKLKSVKGDSMFFLILSGAALAFSRYFLTQSTFLGYGYTANILAQIGIIVTVLLCVLFLKDKVTVRSGLGELLITLGYVLLVI